MTLRYAFAVYSGLIKVLLFLFLIFLGVLSDEGVRINKFAKVYVLGIETNFGLLGGFVVFILLLIFIFQLLFLLKILRLETKN
jgi:TRAP-type C4-dicarboxylate transport system permease small subunit